MMHVALGILAFVALVLLVLLVLSVMLNIKLKEKLYELGDQINESLDILDTVYSNISMILETPVASDDPIVRKFIENVKSAREAVLLIANKIVSFDGQEENEDGE